MKRIAIIVVMALMSLTASATSIRYFTYAQASRTVKYLNAQQEMMIYCGYDYEIETYVLINEVWMERINSAYYELWVYGYDAYTGDEIYMPLDLQCVWLYSAGRMYNAAQYLRFHATVHKPSFAWYVPAYNPYTRRVHMVGYVRSYHYDIHRHGWVPPATPMHGWGPHTHPPLPPYYMRTPQTPAPVPTNTWTPGVEHPQVSNTGSRGGQNGSRSSESTMTNTRGTATSTSTNSGTARSGASRTTETRGTANASDGETRGTTTTRGTGTTPTRSNTGTATRSTATQDEGTDSRSAGTTRSTTTGTRSTGTATSTRSTRSTGTTTSTRSTGTTSGSRSTGTTTGTSRSGNGNATATRSGSSTTTTRSGNTSGSASRSGSTTRKTEPAAPTSRSTNVKR